MQTQTPRNLSASTLASLPPHLPIKPTRHTFGQNIAISAIAFLSLSSVLSATPNENNLQGGGGHKMN